MYTPNWIHWSRQTVGLGVGSGEGTRVGSGEGTGVVGTGLGRRVGASVKDGRFVGEGVGFDEEGTGEGTGVVGTSVGCGEKVRGAKREGRHAA